MFKKAQIFNASFRQRKNKLHKTKEWEIEFTKRFLNFYKAAENVKQYYKGARVWIPHSTLVWEPAEVVLDYASATLKVEFSDGRVVDLKIAADSELPPLRNPEILLGENDLTALSYLHEPAVLHNLNHRFCSLSTIYTYCGIVLVAINPYDELHIYDNDTIWTYRGKSQGDLDPHIFAVAEEAYTRLERESKDQSIIVSGESGAGKTVSAKYVMRYFATVGGSAQETQVEKKVLSSSPIMEAIGNAKTTRNDNSSRFGKFIEIKFNKSYHIIGASMRTYLLEKSRVVFQAPGERNYHIFYQLCAAKDKLPHLNLSHQDEFAFLNQGDSPFVDGVNDLDSFEETVQALNTLGFSWRDQENLFKILAAVLHLGNVGLHKQEEGSAIKKDDKHLACFSELLELDSAEMRRWLCNRQIVSTKEVFNKPMSTTEAAAAREALSKHMYSQIFNWIVSVVNQALENTKEGSDHRFIGVLDIYGFETFEINSFEQFCINYANEKLQQQFNQHVFKLEQEEYLKEGIEWKFIDFYDNQPCIDLIESKLGILDLLDEECRMPNGSDGSWAEKLYKTCGKYKHFAKPRFGNSSYIIHHFADNVEYQADGFLDKNRDSVVEEQIGVLKNSKNKFIGKLFADERGRQLSIPSQQTRVKIVPAARGPTGTGGKQNKKTVGSQFRDSLNLLMGTLNATTPHYVRCIKPNDDKKAFAYNPQRAVQQLRACGVLETIRISAAGFPSRWLYRDFFLRYRVLCLFKDINRNDMESTCQKILVKHIQDADKYQFGKTKIFFRAGQVAFLEKLRADKLRACCIMIQKNIRSFIHRKKFKRIIKSLHLLQRYSRGLIARRKAKYLRQTKAAITIQRRMRGWVKRSQYLRLRRNIVGIQTYIRGTLARRRYQEMRYNHSAIVIQRFVRGFLARRRYAKEMHHVVIGQSAIRRFLARRKLRALKKEARSVEHVKKLNIGLENKIISLQQKIGEMTKTMNILKSLEPEVIELRTKLEALRSVEVENKKSEIILKEKQEILLELEEKLRKEEAEKMDLLTEKMSSADKLRIMEENYNHLKIELDRVNDLVSKSHTGFEDNLKLKLEQERALLHKEHEHDLENYQKLLQDYGALEHRYENLERQLSNKHTTHNRSPSDTSTLSSHTSNEFENDDIGYGSSTRSNTPRSRDHEELDRSLTELSHVPEIDVGLMLKLQQRLKDVEKERDRLYDRIEILEKDEAPESPVAEKQETVDKLKLEELEIENEKLKRNLEVLRDSLATGDPGTKELLNQFRASEWELDRRRDEIIQLRAILATQAKGLKNIARINYGSTSDVNLDVINEDGELVMAFEAQKRIARQLEDELQHEKDRRRVETTEYRAELQRLKEDNERQQKLLSGNLNKSPQSQSEAYMQHEISRSASENLHLKEKLDKIQDVARTLKKQNKFLLKQLKDSGIKIECIDGSADNPAKKHELVKRDTSATVVIKKERNYEGMFEYRIEDERAIIRNLILELSPRLATKLLPCLPSYIVFMCVRHIDFVNDEEKVRSLFAAFINAVKKIVKKKSTDFDITVLWLSNTIRLMHTLKQYSGDKIFQVENSTKQNEQCLRNFDLCQYRQVLSDTAVWIYQAVVANLQNTIQPLIVGAILEHEAIVGLEKGMRHRTTSLSNVADTKNDTKHLDQLIAYLTRFHHTLVIFGVDPDIIVQIFKQAFYFICASSLNNLLLKKDLCNWAKGMQIRYNLSHLEQWARDQLSDPSVIKTLEPLIQASQLLQARKLEGDVTALCEMCDQLTVQRIVKLLNLYTKLDEYEEQVSSTFLKKMQDELKKRRGGSSSPSDQQGLLMMDIKMVYPVRFPFTPSKIRLEDVDIPEALDLPMLKKV